MKINPNHAKPIQGLSIGGEYFVFDGRYIGDNGCELGIIYLLSREAIKLPRVDAGRIYVEMLKQGASKVDATYYAAPKASELRFISGREVNDSVVWNVCNAAINGESIVDCIPREVESNDSWDSLSAELATVDAPMSSAVMVVEPVVAPAKVEAPAPMVPVAPKAAPVHRQSVVARALTRNYAYRPVKQISF